MRIVNRLLGVVLLLLLLAAALVTLGLVLGLLTVAEVRQVWPYTPVVMIGRDAAHLPTPTQPWVIGGALVVAVLAVLGLARELAPPPRRARLLTLRDAGPGHTEIAYSTLDTLASDGARNVAGIERVRARVDPLKGGLSVRGRALVSPYVELATAAPALEQAIVARLERATGLPVRTVRLRTVVQEEHAHRGVR